MTYCRTPNVRATENGSTQHGATSHRFSFWITGLLLSRTRNWQHEPRPLEDEISGEAHREAKGTQLGSLDCFRFNCADKKTNCSARAEPDTAAHFRSPRRASQLRPVSSTFSKACNSAFLSSHQPMICKYSASASLSDSRTPFCLMLASSITSAPARWISCSRCSIRL